MAPKKTPAAGSSMDEPVETVAPTTTTELPFTEDPLLVSCREDNGHLRDEIKNLKNNLGNFQSRVTKLGADLNKREIELRDIKVAKQKREDELQKELLDESNRHKTELEKTNERWEKLLREERDRNAENDKKMNEQLRKERDQFTENLRKKDSEFESLKGN